MFLCHIIPQAGVFIPFRETCIDLYRLAIDLNAGLRLVSQVEVPIGVMVLSPVGLNDQILAFIVKLHRGG